LKEQTEQRATDEALPDESGVTDSTRCDGYCDREIHEAATVDVVAGAVVGEWDDPEPHVGVSGVEGERPEIEQWCVSCASQEFDVNRSAHEKRVETAKRYITASNLASFFLGVTLVSLFVLMV